MREAGTGRGMDGEFQAWQPRTARAQHYCDGLCNVLIEPGERYLELRICYPPWETMRLCSGCEAEHDRQCGLWGEAMYEVGHAAADDGLVFVTNPRGWVRPEVAHRRDP